MRVYMPGKTMRCVSAKKKHFNFNIRFLKSSRSQVASTHARALLLLPHTLTPPPSSWRTGSLPGAHACCMAFTRTPVYLRPP